MVDAICHIIYSVVISLKMFFDIVKRVGHVEQTADALEAVNQTVIPFDVYLTIVAVILYSTNELPDGPAPC